MGALSQDFQSQNPALLKMVINDMFRELDLIIHMNRLPNFISL